MMSGEDESFDIDKLLKGLFRPPEGLKDLFGYRIRSLNISTTQALEILGMQHRTLTGMLAGTQKVADYTNLIKLAAFLQIPTERVVQLYMEALEKSFPGDLKLSISTDRVQFIKENFDLAALKKARFIDSITDYAAIEKKLTWFLGLQTIEEYRRPSVEAAFSAGLIQPKNPLTRSTWSGSAEKLLETISNPHDYNREGLIDFFPQIRWFSRDVEMGLIDVIKSLYQLGVTVVYQPYLTGLHLRGATFAVNGKPGIVLTNYRNFYPTLWWALVHELFHVLFDWEEIEEKTYHLSPEDDQLDQLSEREKEREANEFARKYLFSKEKTDAIRPRLRNEAYVKQFTETNHVHPSFPYVFNAYDLGHPSAWARAHEHNPQMEMEILLKKLENPWDNAMSVADHARSLRTTILT